MAARDIIVIGSHLDCVAGEDVIRELATFKPNAQLTDEVKKAKDAKDRQEKAVANVKKMKLLTTIKSFYAVNLTTKSVCAGSENDDDDESPVQKLVNWLMGIHEFSAVPKPDQTAPLFYGFNVRECLRALGPASSAIGLPVPLSLWYGSQETYDPYEMLVESEYRDNFLLPALCRVARLTYHTPGAGDPQADAVLAIELITRYQLAPLVVEPSMSKRQQQSLRPSKKTKVDSKP